TSRLYGHVSPSSNDTAVNNPEPTKSSPFSSVNSVTGAKVANMSASFSSSSNRKPRWPPSSGSNSLEEYDHVSPRSSEILCGIHPLKLNVVSMTPWCWFPSSEERRVGRED